MTAKKEAAKEEEAAPEPEPREPTPAEEVAAHNLAQAQKSYDAAVAEGDRLAAQAEGQAE